MSDFAAKAISIAIIIFATAYAISNRYSVVASSQASLIMTKDNWTGAVEMCSHQSCFQP